MSGSHAKQITPGDDIIPVVEDTPFDVCRGLWIGSEGNITIVTKGGVTRGPIAVLTGLFPMKCIEVVTTASNPASDIHAIY